MLMIGRWMWRAGQPVDQVSLDASCCSRDGAVVVFVLTFRINRDESMMAVLAHYDTHNEGRMN